MRSVLPPSSSSPLLPLQVFGSEEKEGSDDGEAEERGGPFSLWPMCTLAADISLPHFILVPSVHLEILLFFLPLAVITVMSPLFCLPLLTRISYQLCTYCLTVCYVIHGHLPHLKYTYICILYVLVSFTFLRFDFDSYHISSLILSQC